MEWHIEHTPEFYIMAMQREFNEESAIIGIPEFYKEYAGSKISEFIRPHIGICMTPEAGYDWIYGLGDMCEKNALKTRGFDVITIPEQDYAVFVCDNANELWNYIYGEWFLTGGYEILPMFTLEYYNDKGQINEIHVPVKKREHID